MRQIAHLLLCFLLIGNLSSLWSQNSFEEQLKHAISNEQELGFTENKGQFADDKGQPVPSVFLRSSLGSVDLFVTEKGLTYVFNEWKDRADSNKIEIKRLRVDVDLAGATISADQIVKESALDNGRTDYYLAHCPDGIFDVKTYRRVVVKDVYPGIDWVLKTSKDEGVKYDFIVHPGGDPAQIKLVYKGAESLTVSADKSVLAFTTPMGEIKEGELFSYQVGSKNIGSEYVLDGSIVGFDVENYDSSIDLVIDPPLMLKWCTYYGGNSNEGAYGVTTDNSDNTYVTGFTASTTFPTFNPGTAFVQTINAGHATGVSTTSGGGLYGDMFLMKFDASGARQWATYYGGDGGDRGNGVATDNAGNVYVVGATTSFDFPLQNLPGAYNQTTGPTANTGLADATILKFTSNGTRLWATYYGSDNTDQAMDVTTDNAGNVYITGFAGCYNFPLPPSPGGGAYYQSTYGGGGHCNDTYSALSFSGDVFILKLNPAGAVVWGTLFGGNEGDSGHGIALDNAGNIFVTGQSQSTNLPCVNPGGGAYFNNANSGNGSFFIFLLSGDAFVAKFSPTYNLLWSTYCGGAFGDSGEDIGVNSAGDVYVVGKTASANFPLQNLAGSYNQAVIGGPSAQSELEGDGFIMKFNNTGSMLWSTYYGGSTGDVCNSIVFDKCENYYISGRTTSSNFPQQANPGSPFYYDATYGGNTDIFVLGFSKNDVRDWSTFYGGSGGEGSNGITINSKGELMVVGASGSSGLSRNQTGAYNKGFYSGPNDILMVQFAPRPIDLSNNASTNPLCYGGANGTATVVPSGGTSPYTYQWNTVPPQTGSTATGLAAGTYSVIVSDASCVEDTLAVTINQPALFQAFVPTQGNVACNGDITGWATATQTGGSAPFNYSWSNAQTTASITNVGAGTYTITITDNNGCTAQTSTQITEPLPLNVSSSITNSPQCNGDATGALSLNVNGGTAGYTYSWNIPNATTSIVTGLAAGNYSVQVTDNFGCTTISTVVITEPPLLTMQLSSTPEECLSVNGTATASPGGGTGAYTFLWSPTLQNTQTATGLAAGTYTATLTDNNGCTLSSFVDVTQRSADTLTLFSASNASCSGSCDGEVTMQLSGLGNGPYNYSWSTAPPQSGLTATGLCSGVYTLTVTDNSGCSDTMSVSIQQPSVISSTLQSTSTLCFGDNTGRAFVSNVSGGVPSYSYQWSNGGTNMQATALTSGVYTVTVSDANGCTQQQSVQVSDAPQLTLSLQALNAICSGQQANLNASVGGGTPSYNYAWNTGQTTSGIVTPSLTTNTTFSLVVTDANGCTTEVTTEVQVNALPEVSFSSDTTQGCMPLCVTFSHTTQNVSSVLWTFGDGSSSPQNSPVYCYNQAGTYDVLLTVTDNNGCTNSLQKLGLITVYPSPVANFTATPQPATILDPSISFTNLSQNATAWNWSFGDVTSSQSTQQHPVYIYDDTGSYYVQLVAVNEFGCTDTIVRTIEIEPDYILYIPNTFTPNGDGLNEVFKPEGIGIDIENYELLIFDRWGNLIFKSNNSNVGWDGKVKGGSEVAQQDTYVWKVIASDFRGKKYQYVGHVNVIR